MTLVRQDDQAPLTITHSRRVVRPYSRYLLHEESYQEQNEDSTLFKEAMEDVNFDLWKIAMMEFIYTSFGIL